MASQYQPVYEAWFHTYRLTHPEPIRGKIDIRAKGQLIVALGAALLSGTQTGASMMSVTQLPTVFSQFGLPEQLAFGIVFLTSFFTFEATIFVAGLTLKTKEGDRWYWVQVTAAMLVAILTALHIGPKWVPIDIVKAGLALGGPIIAFVAGKSIGGLRQEIEADFQAEMKKYGEAVQHAWAHSPQWKSIKATDVSIFVVGPAKPIAPIKEAKTAEAPPKKRRAKKPTKTIAHAKTVLDYLNQNAPTGNWVLSSQIADEVKEDGHPRFNSSQAVLPAIDYLVRQKLVVRDKMSVRLSISEEGDF